MTTVNFMVERNSIIGYLNAYRASNENEVLKAKTRIAVNSMGGLTTTEFFISAMKFYEQTNIVDDFVSSLSPEDIDYLGQYNPGFALRMEKMHYQEMLKTSSPKYRLGQFLSTHPVELGELLSRNLEEEELSSFYIHENILPEIMVDNGLVDSTYDVIQGEDSSDRVAVLAMERKSFHYAGLRTTNHEISAKDEAQLVIDFYVKYGYKDSTSWDSLKQTSAWVEYKYEESEVSEDDRLGYLEFFEEMSANINGHIFDALKINSPYDIKSPPSSPLLVRENEGVYGETAFVHGKVKLFLNDKKVDSLMTLFPVTNL